MSGSESNFQRAAYSVPEFCDAHGISKVFLYKLEKQGMAPRMMRIGKRTLISVEAAAEWRRRFEEEGVPA